MLTKKKQIFRERLRKRSDHGMNHDDDSDNFEEEEEERPETFAALRRIVRPHRHKKSAGVDDMLLRLYEPILFRSLNVANPAVRANSG